MQGGRPAFRPPYGSTFRKPRHSYPVSRVWALREGGSIPFYWQVWTQVTQSVPQSS